MPVRVLVRLAVMAAGMVLTLVLVYYLGDCGTPDQDAALSKINNTPQQAEENRKRQQTEWDRLGIKELVPCRPAKREAR